MLLALAFAVLLAPVGAAAEGQLTIDPQELMKPWTGDLDAMVERRIIRVLTVQSRTFYFVDQGMQRGVTYEALRLFEKDLNEKLAKAGKRKQKHLGVQVFFIPVGRDELLPALRAGKGDIAAANLTITPERLAQVDFSAPAYPNVSELLVSGPASPAVATLDDLAGQQVFVNETSSYHASLVALNQRLAEKKLPAVSIQPAPAAFEDEDLIEMVNAGLIPFTVVDKHKADFWKQVFPKVVVHDAIPLRTGGDIAWAIRKGSPQLKAALDDFLARNRKGTLAGNVILKRYLANAEYVQDAGSEARAGSRAVKGPMRSARPDVRSERADPATAGSRPCGSAPRGCAAAPARAARAAPRGPWPSRPGLGARPRRAARRRSALRPDRTPP